MQGLDLEILSSQIKNLNLTIPWTSINSKVRWIIKLYQPIKVEIEGIHLFVSNITKMSEKKKKQMAEKIWSLKF